MRQTNRRVGGAERERKETELPEVRKVEKTEVVCRGWHEVHSVQEAYAEDGTRYIAYKKHIQTDHWKGTVLEQLQCLRMV